MSLINLDNYISNVVSGMEESSYLKPGLLRQPVSRRSEIQGLKASDTTFGCIPMVAIPVEALSDSYVVFYQERIPLWP